MSVTCLFHLARATAVLAIFACCARARTSSFPQLANPDFEAGDLGREPSGWRVPSGLQRSGYTATVTDAEPANGRQCVLITKGEGVADPAAFGNLLQSIDATPFRGKRVRFHAAVRADVTDGNQAALWLRVDRAAAGNEPAPMGFFDNMAERPISAKTWSHYEIIGDIETDAANIFVGCMLQKAGRVWFDDASLEVLGDAGTAIAEAPRAVSPQGLANLVAFTRLLGYVRYFHPSDEAAATSWEAFAVDGIRAVESAGSTDELAQKLAEIFAPIAPSVRVQPVGAAPDPLELQNGNSRLIVWEHIGLGTGGTSGSIYQSKRTTRVLSDSAAPPPGLRTPFVAELGHGLACSVPLAVLVDDAGTLPRSRSASSAQPTLPKPTKSIATPGDRATRLAAVALAWNVLQHSYPYFDVVGTDWVAELKIALERAATDTDGIAFLATLRRLIAALHDGHGRATFAADNRATWPGFRAEWVEDRLIVAFATDPVRQLGLHPGDALVSLDGRPIGEIVAEAEAEISGATPQWIRFRSSQSVFRGFPNSSITVEFERFATPGGRKTVTVTRETADLPISKRQGETLREVEPGIFYLDLDRLTTADFVAALPRLEKARGLVFDLRGYPSKLAPHEFFSHLTRTPLTSAQWHTPRITRPDQAQMTFIRGGEWSIAPKEPYLTARRAFITDGRAISYAESCMGIVEHYKLGAIVGGPTAGTNGNINRMSLPGGYTIVWTGMKVLKHDGSRHHGVGIQPTIPCRPTRAGIAAGRDELLERAIQAAKEGHRRSARPH